MHWASKTTAKKTKRTKHQLPRGPKGQKRPADVVSNATKVVRIATGEDDDGAPVTGKDPNAAALGQKGGAVRAKPPHVRRASK